MGDCSVEGRVALERRISWIGAGDMPMLTRRISEGCLFVRVGDTTWFSAGFSRWGAESTVSMATSMALSSAASLTESVEREERTEGRAEGSAGCVGSTWAGWRASMAFISSAGSTEMSDSSSEGRVTGSVFASTEAVWTSTAMAGWRVLLLLRVMEGLDSGVVVG